MLLRELIYQHVYDAHQPVRLDAESQVSVMKVPGSASSADIQDLVLSTLYPKQTPHATRMALAGTDEAKVAAVFEHRQRSYRILRRADPESLRLQVKESSGWRDLAAGSLAVDERLSQSLGRPEFEVFWALNLWRFDRSPSEATAFDLDVLDPKLRDVVLKFRVARAVETVEDALKSTESRIAERTKELGQGAALEEKLRKAKERLVEIEVSELSEKDLELLKDKDTRMPEFALQLNRLEEQEETEKHQIDLIVPDAPTRHPAFWVGLLLSIGALVMAIDPATRAVALVDVIGFGLVAWVLFNYFDQMERASLHQVRLESIKRRLNQVREEQAGTNERINHVLIHAGVRDAKEMGERIVKAEQLSEVIGKMERRVDELRRDAGYMSALEDLERLRKRQVELVAERRELPEDTLSSFQLENDLTSLGIDPVMVLEKANDRAADEDDEGPLKRLLSSAAIVGQWDDIELYPKTRKMWGKICGHVLGDKFSEVGVTTEGTLQIGDLDPEQIQMWRKTRPSEFEVLMRALAIAIQVGSDERSRRGMFESLVLIDPASYLTAVQVKKLQEVFASAAQRTGVVILEQ